MVVLFVILIQILFYKKKVAEPEDLPSFLSSFVKVDIEIQAASADSAGVLEQSINASKVAKAVSENLPPLRHLLCPDTSSPEV